MSKIRRSQIDLPDPEVKGDKFDRQKVIVDWDQELIEKQVAFILGVGGVGCSIALGLARLGIKKIILLDRDVVDASNLNRQILFGKDDIGLKKVEAAKKNIQLHNLQSEIEIHHIDATVNWDKVVEIASFSTVLFNAIDYGAVFDYAVNSLSRHFNIPCLSASTYANNIELTYYSGVKPGCFNCHQTTIDSFKLPKIPNNMNSNEFISFLYENLQIELLDEFIIETFKIYNNIINSSQLPFIMEIIKNEIIERLSPSNIYSINNISFIPKDSQINTRTVGSWVGVACSGSILLINQWIRCLMIPQVNINEWVNINTSLYSGSISVDSFSIVDKSCKICNKK